LGERKESGKRGAKQFKISTEWKKIEQKKEKEKNLNYILYIVQICSLGKGVRHPSYF
jgi:hypothetical protein